MDIGNDFGDNGRTSQGMANRELPLDSLRPIGLYNSRDGVLTVVLWPFVIPLKNVEISADFGYYCTTSEGMANRRLLLHSLRSNRPVYLPEWRPNCGFIAIRCQVKETQKSRPILAITAQPAMIWPIGGYQWIPRVEYDYIPPGMAF